MLKILILSMILFLAASSSSYGAEDSKQRDQAMEEAVQSVISKEAQNRSQGIVESQAVSAKPKKPVRKSFFKRLF